MGDPLQKDQWKNTLSKLISLEMSNHSGPVGLITKSLLTKTQLERLKKSPLDVWVFMSITGLNENKKTNFDKIRENYLKACSELKHVIVYLRPIIPNYNDNLKAINPIIDLAAKGQKLIVVRGYKDINLSNRPYLENKKLTARISKICGQKKVKMYERTVCAVSDFYKTPCPVHENLNPVNVEFIRKIGYPLHAVNGNLFPDPKLGGDSYPWTRGDKNFIKIICHNAPKLPKLNNLTLLSKTINDSFCDCTSSWFGWTRQAPCTINCWYCIASSKVKPSKLRSVGCNPLDLKLWLSKKNSPSKAMAVFGIIHSLYAGGIEYSADARFKLVWHRKNFTNFLKFKDGLIRPVTAEFWPSLSCNARCSLCPYRANKARENADKSNNLILTTPKIAKRVSSQLAKFGIHSVLLTGGGEPFMNPNIDKIAKIFKNKGLKLGIYTNGTVPNRESQIRNIVRLEPKFIRMSINAGSEKEHQNEYHIESANGKSAWKTIKENALIYLDEIKKSKANTSFGFSFVLLGNEQPSSYVGMAKFIREIHEASNKLPLYAHFRPKFIYYKSNGAVNPELAAEAALNIGRIAEKVKKYVLPNLPKSKTLKIQNNAYALNYASKNAKAHPAFCTGWATSFNHLGEGYILSELCGSKWPGSKWGNLMSQTMNSAWFSKERLKLHKEYSNGKRKAPVYNKLTGVQNLLSEIRATVKTPLNDKEIKLFWTLFDNKNYARPSSWDFI
ncbi:MAG: radical SAM protein [Candidatus Diapherotrites archaeon]|nr:radical SAM protein [Candidatus Diapherotrites archaeon]